MPPTITTSLNILLHQQLRVLDSRIDKEGRRVEGADLVPLIPRLPVARICEESAAEGTLPVANRVLETERDDLAQEAGCAANEDVQRCSNRVDRAATRAIDPILFQKKVRSSRHPGVNMGAFSTSLVRLRDFKRT